MKNLCFENLPEAVGLLIEKIESLEKHLLENSGKRTTEQSDQLMTVDQAAEFLNLAKPTVYSMVSRGELPYMKRSKRLYFSRKDLIAYIRDGRKKTKSEMLDSASDFLTKRRGGDSHG